MDIPGIPSFDRKVDRVESGSGSVRKRTMEIGSTVLAIDNIGTLNISSGGKSYLPVIIGAAVVVTGISMFETGSQMLGGALVVAGLALVVWGFLRPRDTFLSIGTCDGRQTHIVSKDKKFLSDVRNLLERKIDSKSLETATININARTISGGIAVGDGAMATGESSAVNL